MTPSAARASRYRDRIKRGVVLVSTEVPRSLIQTLVRIGELPDEPNLDGRRIGDALRGYIEKKVRNA